MSNTYVKYEKIIDKLDIKKNDVILFVSDLTRLLLDCKNNNENFDGNNFLDSIIEKIGKEGTLLLPTFNYDFCKGKTYDYSKSLSITGALTKAALSRKDFKRTQHPIHSFAVWGKDKDYLYNLKNLSSFGANSPFEYLYRKNAKNLTFGLDYKLGFATVHYCEEKVGVSYRFLKNFESLYIDENNKKELRKYQMYVRKDPHLSVKTNISSKLDEILKLNNEYKKYKINNNIIFLINLKVVVDIMIKDIKTSQEIVHLLIKKK